jgi:hypothetical protein
MLDPVLSSISSTIRNQPEEAGRTLLILVPKVLGIRFDKSQLRRGPVGRDCSEQDRPKPVPEVERRIARSVSNAIQRKLESSGTTAGQNDRKHCAV